MATTHPWRMSGRLSEMATNNIFAIFKRVPKSSRVRKTDGNKYATPSKFDDLIKQMKSGVWDGKGDVPHLRSGADFSFCRDSETPLWSRSEKVTLGELLDKLEKSPRFNPHGLKFIRNLDGSVWFWRLDHRHPSADWDFINREFIARFWTLNKWCNREYETCETPCTLFLFYAIQWLRTGGKCHFFGFTLTFAARHPCAYSIGRAVCVYDNDGTYIRDVVAGEAMYTGFSSPFPVSIDEYDRSRCTIMIESWRANSIRGNFAGGQDLIERLKQLILRRSVSDTQWYDAPKRVVEEGSEDEVKPRVVPQYSGKRAASIMVGDPRYSNVTVPYSSLQHSHESLSP